MSIATNLRRELIRHDMSVASLSERTGVSKASINKYLAGDVKPAQEILTRLADGLGITADELDIKREPRMKGANISVETAAKLMGKSAQELNPLINAGSDALRKYGEEAIGETWLEELECRSVLEELAWDMFRGCPMSRGDRVFDIEWDEKYNADQL